MRLKAKLSMIALLGTGALFLQACQEEGPMEQTGAAIDEAAQDAGDQANEAADAAAQGLEDACEGVTDRPC